MESVTLAIPETVPERIFPATTTYDYHVIQINLCARVPWSILVTFDGIGGRKQWFVSDPVRAQNLITALNKADLSVKSLERRCLEQAIADGVFAGTITGLPD